MSLDARILCHHYIRHTSVRVLIEEYRARKQQDRPTESLWVRAEWIEDMVAQHYAARLSLLDLDYITNI